MDDLDRVICDKVVKEVTRYFERHHTTDLARLFWRYLVGSCIIVPKEEVNKEMDKLRGKIKEKDLEQISVVRKYGIT